MSFVWTRLTHAPNTIYTSAWGSTDYWMLMPPFISNNHRSTKVVTMIPSFPFMPHKSWLGKLWKIGLQKSIIFCTASHKWWWYRAHLHEWDKCTLSISENTIANILWSSILEKSSEKNCPPFLVFTSRMNWCKGSNVFNYCYVFHTNKHALKVLTNWK